MEKNLKITIMGVGGIGGLLGGALIRRYGDAVSLIARGAREEHIRQKGLTLHSEVYGDFTVMPGRVTADPSGLPVQDIILICVKNGGLKKAAEQLRPIIGPDTIVLPVMNGVTAGRVLRDCLGPCHIQESVIYTVSSAEEDFSITQKGNYTFLYVGAVRPEDLPGAEFCVRLLQDAGIDCRFSGDIRTSVWTKYLMNCAYNVVTARWDIPFGKIRADKKLMEDYRLLMEEARKVGLEEGADLPDGLIEEQIRDLLNRTTDDSTSSLSRDFDQGKVGEMEVFSGEVIRMADRLGLDVPVTREYDRGLRERAASFGN